jgi:hypothetical protein
MRLAVQAPVRFQREARAPVVEEPVFAGRALLDIRIDAIDESPCPAQSSGA